MFGSKKDFSKLLFSILNPLKDKYTPSHALLDLGSHRTWYPERAARMESFARPLWGLVPYFAGGYSDKVFEEIYIDGIKNGSDPENDDYWGECEDMDQRFVEMAAIAYALLICPQKLWEPLDCKTKDNLANWLYQINEHTVCNNNWILFRILVNSALRMVDKKYSEEHIISDFKRIDEFYLGDGWYKDGGKKDYYVSFAIHYYSLIYAHAMNSVDKQRCDIIKDRAMTFAKTFIYWFADDGEAVPYGRSLTYRFAQCAFWSACLLADIHPFSVPVMKGIISRHLMCWLKNEDIFDNGHILTVGYKYSQLHMAEHYNAPGSPYWALKAFAFMVLPDEHEFWKAEAEPIPELDKFKKIEKADMLLSRYNGNVTMYPAELIKNYANGQMQAKYTKFAYSTLFGFSVPRSNNSLAESAPDSSLVFDIDGLIFQRRTNISCTVNDDNIILKWSPFTGIDVTTTITPAEYGHTRKHIVTSQYDCTAYDCGFAVSAMDGDEVNYMAENRKASVVNIHSKCVVESESGEGEIINASPNTNLMYPKTVIPSIKYEIKKGTNEFETYIYEI